MTTIAEKIIEIQTQITNTPLSVLYSRQAILENIILAEEMRDAFGLVLTTQLDGVKGLNYICEEVGKINSVLKGAASTDMINFDFGDPSFYTDDASFTFPTTTAFGFYIVDSNGNEVTSEFLSNKSLYYLTKDATTNELISIDDDFSPYTAPPVISGVREVILDIFNPDTDTITGSLTYQPTYQTSPTPTITIKINSTIIGTINELGMITSIPAGGYVLDADNSIMNYPTREFKAVFTTKPSTPNQPINVSYNHDTTSSETDITLTYNAGTFSGTMETNWDAPTVSIEVDGTQEVGLSTEGDWLSLKIDTVASYISGNNIVIKFKDTTITSGVVLKYNSRITTSVTEQIATVQQSIVTNYELDNTRVSPDTNVVIYENTKIYIVWVDSNGDSQELEIGQVDSSGNVTGISPYGVTGLLDTPSPGVYQLDLTFTTFPSFDVSLIVQYDYVNQYDIWTTSYTPVSVSSPATTSVNGNNLNILTLTSALGTSPKILKTYPLKRWSDHQIWANFIVVTEGLELDTDWIPYRIDGDGSISGAIITYADIDINYGLGFLSKDLTGKTLDISGGNSYTIASNDPIARTITMTGAFSESGTQAFSIDPDLPQAITKITDTQFRILMGWLDPNASPVYDILTSANPNNVSDGKKIGGVWPNIEVDPFFPATDGEHENEQPGSLGLNDVFAGNYGHFEDSDGDSIDEYKWSVHNDKKWRYDAEPVNVADAAPPLVTDYVATFSSILNEIATFSPSGGDIPQDDTSAPSPVQEDWYELNTNVTPNVIHNIYNETDDLGEITTDFNSVQHYIFDTRQAIVDIQFTALNTLQTAHPQTGSDGYRDPNYGYDLTFWNAYETYKAATYTLATLTAYQASWASSVFTNAGYATGFFRRPGVDPGPTAYPTTNLTGAQASLATLKTAVDTELTSIVNRMGTAIAAGSIDQYSKDLFDAVNKMVGKELNYVGDVVSDYFSLSDFYDLLIGYRNKRDLYLGV